MAYEYAIEPEALVEDQNRRYLVDNMGVGTGRLVAQYPEDWLEKVRHACDQHQPVEQLRVTRDLDVLRKRLVKTNRPYGGHLVWLSNALNAHEHEPFRAIVAGTSEVTHDAILTVSQLRSDTPGWEIPGDGKIQRTAEEMANIAQPLLRLSSVILFVDQHYKSNVTFGRPLSEFLKHAQKGKKAHKIEYHLNAETREDIFVQGLEKQRRFLPFDNGVSMVFVRWKKIDEGENQHPRYILTNRGGLRFDYGLDEGHGSTDWNRLGENLWRDRLAQFNPSMGVYELVDAFKVSREQVVKVTPYNGAWR